jgi:hypothetical protein
MRVAGGLIFLIPLFFCLIGVLLLCKTLWQHIQFKLVNNELVVKEPIQTATSFNLNQLITWRLISYNIRGQQKQSLVLFLANNKKLIVSNEDYKSEFDELSAYLIKNYSDLKI